MANAVRRRSEPVRKTAWTVMLPLVAAAIIFMRVPSPEGDAFSNYRSRSETMSQLPKRSEVPAEQQWRLEDLFASQEQWDQEYKEVISQLSEIKTFEGKLVDADTIKKCFELEDDISLHTERLYVYAGMKHHEDMADPKYQALNDKAKKLSVEVGEALSFITPEILA